MWTDSLSARLIARPYRRPATRLGQCIPSQNRDVRQLQFRIRYSTVVVLSAQLWPSVHMSMSEQTAGDLRSSNLKHSLVVHPFRIKIRSVAFDRGAIAAQRLPYCLVWGHGGCPQLAGGLGSSTSIYRGYCQLLTRS